MKMFRCPMSLPEARYFGLPVLLYLAAVIAFVWLSAYDAKVNALDETDLRLETAAAALPEMLPTDFHDKTPRRDGIPVSEEMQYRERFSRYAAAIGLPSVYTLVPQDGEFHFTALSATPKNKAERTSWYFSTCEKTPDAYRTAILTGKKQFVSYSNESGSFRSIAMPFKSPLGKTYLACADADIGMIRKAVFVRVTKSVGMVTIFLLLGIPFVIAARKSRNAHAQRLMLLSKSIEAYRTKAEKDQMTGLLNKISFYEIGSRVLTALAHRRGSGAVFILDIDDFKKINDTHGHVFGDEIIRGVAKICQESMRDQDIAARFGGEEFTLLLPDVSKDGVIKFAERLLESIKNMRIKAPDGSYPECTASIGGVFFCEPPDNVIECVDTADKSLLIAKAQGKNRFVMSA